MDALVPESSNFRCGWVNSNDYELAHKTFSMIQFLPVFFKPLGMLEFNEVFACKQNIWHKFIAESQGTLVAILPGHTHKERDLFQLLIQSSPLFSDSNQQPNWTALAVVWAGHADGHNIFYKLPEHLKTYYKTWTDFCNEQNTISLNTEASWRIRALICSAPTNVTIKAPTALPTTLHDLLAASPLTKPDEFSLDCALCAFIMYIGTSSHFVLLNTLHHTLGSTFAHSHGLRDPVSL
ncbi:hypothetical protein DFJ58DRAFT_722558 [Suillus subalutaceus]|uniref:uncharacterized protein n=1 Tax=Suillus subalutaceus TaxID=48586 RepID=UPI001B864A16|nr:uncharacterized protein DFJ58DRAFT_722558 [Suillus subalutaceus]KAG1871812.1 hypothetical protein DFJ58DRAFT_722558 [Suillus subalutaceus]